MIVGGGGFRVPLVYSALAGARDRLPITEVVLTDTDPARLAAIQSVLHGMGGTVAVSATTDLDAALTGAAIVFAAVRIGGTAGRVNDERVALAHGLLGQETIGPGGLAYATRTLGFMEDLATRVARLAPDAWIINFTNPAGLITEAMHAHHPRVVGICDTPIGLVRRVARVTGTNLDDAQIGYLGINHLGWLTSFIVDGVDHLPGLLADRELLLRIEEARLLGPDWVQEIGALPNEYLYYYARTREVTQRLTSAEATRGEFLQEQQRGFYERVARDVEHASDAWREALAEREATYMAEARTDAREEEDLSGGYHEVAIDLMAGLLAGEDHRMILNVPNNGAIPELPDAAVIEMPCTVNARGVNQIHPPARLALDQTALILGVKAADRLLIEAVRRGSRSGAWRAFAAHPLLDSTEVARALLTDYIASDPLIAAALPNP